MKKKFLMAVRVILVFVMGLALFVKPVPIQADRVERPLSQVSAYDLIAAMNVLRMSYGLPGLIMDGTINAVAQSTAQIMADQNLSWHIGNVSGRIQAAGYGGGGRVMATENFAMGTNLSIDQIMVMWNDYDHMLPATNPSYCHVGAGVATASNGFTYYILQAAYVSGQACTGTVNPPGGGSGIVPGIITPVELAEVDENGIYKHLVKPGQALWSIAVAYGVTVQEIRDWNGLSKNYVLKIGDELIILSPDAEGYVPPPVRGAIEISTPEADGRVVHTVKAYEYLGKIAEAYGVTVKRITELNGIKETTPLGIGWKLIIVPSSHTPTPTEVPLLPIQLLTPEADGNYYHIVRDGENPGWIADYYGISLADLLAWNNKTEKSVIYPGDKLLLKITPPPTITPTFTPVTPSPTATITPTSTKTPLPSATATPAPVEPKEQKETKDLGVFKVLLPVMAGIAVAVAIILFLRYKRGQKEN